MAWWKRPISRGVLNAFDGWSLEQGTYTATIVSFTGGMHAWKIHHNGGVVASGGERSLEDAKAAVEQELSKMGACHE